MSATYAFAPITKREKDPETGYLTVYGKMTGPQLDLDMQRCDPTWLATAVPDWFSSGGNVRLMHQARAVGKGLELEQQGDDWYLKSLIVDRDAIELCEQDILTGYSIGIKRPHIANKSADTPGGWIRGGLIVETSLADRPCLPDAKFMLAKMAGDELVPTAEWAKKPHAPESEQVTAAKQVLADLAALTADVTKADDETSDITGAGQAIGIIARLIQSEAEGLAAGRMSEYYDIQLLLEALSALRWFRENEQIEQDESEEDDDMDSLISLGVNPDLIKAALADTASDDDRTALRADTLKALGLDGLADTIAAAVTDTVTKQLTPDIDAAKAAAADTAKTVDARLAKVEAMAAPGGPIRARTGEQISKATAADNARSKAAHYRQLASQVDRVTSEGYLALAAQLEASAAV